MVAPRSKNRSPLCVWCLRHRRAGRCKLLLGLHRATPQKKKGQKKHHFSFKEPFGRQRRACPQRETKPFAPMCRLGLQPGGLESRNSWISAGFKVLQPKPIIVDLLTYHRPPERIICIIARTTDLALPLSMNFFLLGTVRSCRFQ